MGATYENPGFVTQVLALNFWQNSYGYLDFCEEIPFKSCTKYIVREVKIMEKYDFFIQKKFSSFPCKSIIIAYFDLKKSLGGV